MSETQLRSFRESQRNLMTPYYFRTALTISNQKATGLFGLFPGQCLKRPCTFTPGLQTGQSRPFSFEVEEAFDR